MAEGLQPSEGMIRRVVAGRLGDKVRSLATKRVLVLGNCSTEGEICLLDGGLLPVDSEGRVRLPAPKIGGGETIDQWQRLSELEALLRP